MDIVEKWPFLERIIDNQAIFIGNIGNDRKVPMRRVRKYFQNNCFCHEKLFLNHRIVKLVTKYTQITKYNKYFHSPQLLPNTEEC